MAEPVRIFFSYSHEDEEHRLRLEKNLSLLRREGLVESWHDRKILPGEKWGEEIDRELARAEIILFLVSADFVASDYCWDVEVKGAMKRFEAGEATVVPIIVRDCDWHSAPFGKVQGLPKDAKPVTSWPNGDEAWADVARGLRRLLKARAASSPATSLQTGAARSGEPDPRRYLEALDAANSYVELRGMGAQVAERLPLDRVYTRLRVRAGRAGGGTLGKSHSKPTPQRPSPEIACLEMAATEIVAEQRDASLAEVLRHHRSAVLVGDPGSGKTTFLRFAAQVLARAILGEDREPVASHLGIEGEVPFPILVYLNRFAHFLAENGDSTCPLEAPEHLWRYLDFVLQGQSHGLPPGELRRRVMAGGCFLLLDGLDEVPGAWRQRVAHIVEQVAIQNQDNRLLLTCRTRAYQGRVALGAIEAFPLAPFGAAEIGSFVTRWSRALHRVETPGRLGSLDKQSSAGSSPPGPAESQAAVESQAAAESQAEAYRQSLQLAIDSHPNVGPLTESPLMLTMLAVVHWNRRQLPEQRADLYQAAVEYLVDSRKDHSPFPTGLRREALQAVALEMFRDEEGVQRTIGLADAAQAAAPILAVAKEEARAFLDAESLHSGLLVSREEGELEFWHLTFQEYLAALDLAMGGDYWDEIEDHLFDDRWNEVVLLLGGCLRRNNGVRGARRYLEKILATAAPDNLPTQARAIGLAGRVLRDLKPYGGDPSEGTRFEEMLTKTLAIFQPSGEPVPEALRVEVGEALGQAGDPRLENEEELRILIPGGTFLMGAQKEDPAAPGYDPEAEEYEGPVHQVLLSPFLIGKYPVTVSQFHEFVEAGDKGYLDPRQWDPTGWAWRDKEGLEGPEGWEDQHSYPNRPVVGVSWYEADAYARWVDGGLPTEAKWEFAARGEEGRRFPWGDADPTEKHAAFEYRIKRAPPVGIYPFGATPEGVADLGGTVFEWCQDWYSSYSGKEMENPVGPAEGASRVLRGGSFYNRSSWLRGASRGLNHPGGRRGNIGFRVVWVVAED